MLKIKTIQFKSKVPNNGQISSDYLGERESTFSTADHDRHNLALYDFFND